MSAPKDPSDYRPRALLGPSFWAMIALAVVCILAGIAIATLGPKLLPRRPTPRSATPEAVAAPVKAAGLMAPAVLAASPTPGAPAPSAEVEGLKTRVSALETAEARTSQAAATALAAAAVVEAAQGSAPFSDELSGLRALSPSSPELTVLARLAQAGAPSRAALATSFPDYAARAATAARAPGDGAGVGERIVYAVSRVVSLRRVGEVAGGGPDAILAHAERMVEDGDFDQALRSLDKLPPGARDALAPWRANAERRAEIDRNASALRARALGMLAGAARPAA
jgi:hypothetical protein